MARRLAGPRRDGPRGARSIGLLAAQGIVAGALAAAACHPRTTTTDRDVASASAAPRAEAPTSAAAASGRASAPAGSAREARAVVVSTPERAKTSCPRDSAFVSGPPVCIQRWEAQIIDSAGRTHDPYAVPPHPNELAGYSARSAPGVVPQGYLGREQAELLCAATADGAFRYRLCTTSEWEAACRGPRGEFPRFQSELVTVCNTGKFPELEHLVYRFYPVPEWSYRELTDRRINQEPGGLARTGEHRRCTNGYGVFDMVGNLQEWTQDLLPRGAQVMSVIKGDHYMGQGKNYEGCAATNRAHFYLPPSDPAYRLSKDWKDYSTGLRCCADPR